MNALRCVLLAAVASAALAAPAASSGGWGADVDGKAAQKLIESVQPDLLALVKAPPAERPELAKKIAAKHGASACEALKRFRDPALIELVKALLDDPDWHVRHRALFLADGLGDPAVVPLAWPLLTHEQARMREKAALTCLLLWDPKRAKDVAGGKAKEELAARITAESDSHVRSALHALEQRIAGRLEPHRLVKEVTVKLPDGLQIAPFLDNMQTLATVAPGVKLTPTGSPGGSSADKLPPAPRWCAPLVEWGKEEVPGLGLQPFANPRENGVVHTGLDTGGCLDGAGLYALADGIVRFIYAGSDMGTLIVVEHHRTKKELVNALYMHCGPVVFVETGARVVAGQLLGTMGLGYSIENGGHFAHLHLGLYPGPFQLTHNYGYKPAKDGLADWLDPAKALKEWIVEEPAKK